MSTASPKDAQAPTGLIRVEAQSRLAKSGPNAMPDTALHPLRRALTKYWAPVPWMIEAAIISAPLAFNAARSLFQEGRAQATLAALKSRLALNASVKRDKPEQSTRCPIGGWGRSEAIARRCA